MQGRIEDSIKVNHKIQEHIVNMPSYMIEYYYYLSEKTYMTKERYISYIVRFLTEYGDGDINNVQYEDLPEITSTDIQKFMMNHKYKEGNKQVSPSTQACIYSSINSFMEFLRKKHYIIENPFTNGEIQHPKTHENDIIFLEPDEYAIVKRNIMNGVGTVKAQAKQKKWIYRDLLLFQIPIITGVRVTALSQIAIEDIDFNHQTIHVIDKARNKTLYLDKNTWGILLIWIEHREALLNGKECPYLFISNRRQRISPRSIREIVEKYTSTLDKHISPHKLRSTCGTNMYRATKDIYMVAEVLGHTSPATSRKYTKVSTQDRVEASRLIAEQMASI